MELVFLFSLLFGQLGAISPISGVYLYIHDIVFGVLLLFSFRRFRNSAFRIQHSTLFWPIIAFLVSCLLSLVANSGRIEQEGLMQGVLYVMRWAYYASLYFLVVKSDKPMVWLKGLYATGVGFAILGLVQFFLYPNLRNLMYLGWDPHYYRMFSTLLDPNFAGIIFVLTLFLGIAVHPLLRHRWIVPICSSLAAIAFLLTFSRSSILALLTGLAVWVVHTRQWKIVWVGVAIIVTVIVIPKPGGDTLNIFRSISSVARIDNWAKSISLIQSSPLVGHGFYALPRSIEQSDDWVRGGATIPMVSRATAQLDHSLLFVFATTGIIGLLSYLWLFLRAERMMGAGVTHHASRVKQNTMGVVGLMSLAALVVHSMFVNSLFYAWTMIWMWVLFGAIEAHGNNGKKR